MSTTLTATPLEQDAELATVAALQTAFKHGNLARIACSILKAAMSNGGAVWPDDPALLSVTTALAGDDKNCIGTAYRWLGKCNLITRTQERRRSTSKASKGREVTKWKIANWRLCGTFLARNDAKPEPPQQELFV